MTDPAFESYDCGSVVVGIEPFRWDEVERELDGLEGEEAETARRMVGRALYMIVSLLSQHREPRMICDLMIRELNADKEPLETIAVRLISPPAPTPRGTPRGDPELAGSSRSLRFK